MPAGFRLSSNSCKREVLIRVRRLSKNGLAGLVFMSAAAAWGQQGTDLPDDTFFGNLFRALAITSATLPIVAINNSQPRRVPYRLLVLLPSPTRI